MREDRAQHVRWLFDTVDATDVRDLSLRGLAVRLEVEQRAPTSSGKGNWSAKQVWNLLRNPKYAGLGRNLRFATEWSTFQDKETHEVTEGYELTDRLRSEQWDAETYAVADGAIPALVSPEQFARVQAKVDALKAQNKPGRTTPHGHAGAVHVARRGLRAVRLWPEDDPLL